VMKAEEATVRRSTRRSPRGTGMLPAAALSRTPSGTCQDAALSLDHRGWDAIFGDFFSKIGALSGGTFRAELVDVLVGNQRVAAYQHATGERAGRRLDVTGCQVMSFRDGRIADVCGHYSDQYQLDEFWS